MGNKSDAIGAVIGLAIMLLWWLGGAVITLALIYAAFHFIVKYW